MICGLSYAIAASPRCADCGKSVHASDLCSIPLGAGAVQCVKCCVASVAGESTAAAADGPPPCLSLPWPSHSQGEDHLPPVTPALADTTDRPRKRRRIVAVGGVKRPLESEGGVGNPPQRATATASKSTVIDRYGFTATVVAPAPAISAGAKAAIRLRPLDACDFARVPGLGLKTREACCKVIHSACAANPNASLLAGRPPMTIALEHEIFKTCVSQGEILPISYAKTHTPAPGLSRPFALFFCVCFPYRPLIAAASTTVQASTEYSAPRWLTESKRQPRLACRSTRSTGYPSTAARRSRFLPQRSSMPPRKKKGLPRPLQQSSGGHRYHRQRAFGAAPGL